MKTVYGPVPSGRLGKSLGIDPVCRKDKPCSFDCIYCQLGQTKTKTTTRENFVSPEELEKDFKEALKKAEADTVTFSGTSEPTLAKNLGKLHNIVRKMTDLPTAILTNSSLLTMKEVRDEVKMFDVVVAKLDAGNEKVFEEINKPCKELEFDKILEGIKKLRKECKGKFALQCMFLDKNKNLGKEIAEIAREIEPDEIQINTPLRPCAVNPLPKEQITKIKKDFVGMNIISVYDTKKPKAITLDLKETKIRRPVL